MDKAISQQARICGRYVLTLLFFFVATPSQAAHSSASHHKTLSEARLTSISAKSRPMDVKVISMPRMAAPQVTVKMPRDRAAKQLVDVTWGLVFITGFLVAATLKVGKSQMEDIGRRERAVMMRESNRLAHKVMVEATRVEQLARQVPTARTQMYSLAGQSGMPPPIAEMVNSDLTARVNALENMVKDASFVLRDPGMTTSPLEKLSDEELTQKLWYLDTLIVRLDAMREAIAEELERYERESATLRRNRNEIEAAALAGRMSQAPKT